MFYEFGACNDDEFGKFFFIQKEDTANAKSVVYTERIASLGTINMFWTEIS